MVSGRRSVSVSPPRMPKRSRLSRARSAPMHSIATEQERQHETARSMASAPSGVPAEAYQSSGPTPRHAARWRHGRGLGVRVTRAG